MPNFAFVLFVALAYFLVPGSSRDEFVAVDRIDDEAIRQAFPAKSQEKADS